MQILTAPAPEKGAQFGRSLAMALDVLVVGEHGRDGPTARDQGAIHIYLYDELADKYEFHRTIHLTPSQVAPGSLAGEQFGAAVAINADANRIAVGAFAKQVGGVDLAGAGYVYYRGIDW